MEGGFLEKNGSLSMRGITVNGVMLQCRRKIFGLHQSTLVIADGELWAGRVLVFDVMYCFKKNK